MTEQGRQERRNGVKPPPPPPQHTQLQRPCELLPAVCRLLPASAACRAYELNCKAYARDMPHICQKQDNTQDSMRMFSPATCPVVVHTDRQPAAAGRRQGAGMQVVGAGCKCGMPMLGGSGPAPQRRFQHHTSGYQGASAYQCWWGMFLRLRAACLSRFPPFRPGQLRRSCHLPTPAQLGACRY